VSVVVYGEMAGYPQESWEAGQFRAVRKLLVDWDYRYFLQMEVARFPGQLYPYVPQFGARAVSCTIEPFAAQDQLSILYPTLATYDKAILTITYETPRLGERQPYPKDKSPVKHLDQEKSISEQLEPFVETLQFPYTDYRWGSGSGAALVPEEAPLFPLYRCTYTMTRHAQKSVPAEAINLVGNINNASVTPVLLNPESATLVFPTHTLMFNPPVISLSAAEDGTSRFDLTYRFSFRAETWRKFYRNSTKTYEAIYLAGGSVVDWPTAGDFSPLFP